MIRKYVLPAAAIGLLIFAVLQVVRGSQKAPPLAPPAPPPTSPFGNTVAGAGIVEAQTENIAIGSPLPGIVAEVFVKVGQRVTLGTPLFRLDDRQLKAELKAREANLAAAQAQLTKLEQMPRPEELPASEAKVREARATLVDQEEMLKRDQRLIHTSAVSEEDLVRRRQAVAVAREQFARADAEFKLLRAGAWEPDKAVARATVQQAQTQVEQTRTELERLVVRAPVDGEVMQVNVRPGEFVNAPPTQPLLMLGNLNKLHVRVDIDEHDIPRFRPGAKAKAMLRGNPQQEYPLTFVRVEPYVVPKKSLTGDNSERVDTRVLQVIYAVDPSYQRLYPGQQMDVFIDALAMGALVN